MKLKSVRLALASTTACALIVAAAQTTRGDSYTVLDLGTLGGTTSIAYGLNDSGQIVGAAFTSNGVYHAAFWADSSSAATDLGTLGGSTSQASAINGSGRIVGTALTSNDVAQLPAYWDSSGSAGVALNGGYGQAFGINNAGHIVGFTQFISLQQHAAYWDNSGSSPEDLGTLGGTYSQAFGINASGQIVGHATSLNDDTRHATFWNAHDSGPFDLGVDRGMFSTAYTINLSGQIVGFADPTNTTVGLASLWNNPTNVVTDLPTLGGTTSVALGINDSGQIVGYSATSNAAVHAALWNDGNSAAVDLNGLISTNAGWVLQIAYGINSSGEIVGYGTVGGHQHAFALIPGSPGPQFTATLSGVSEKCKIKTTSTNCSDKATLTIQSNSPNTLPAMTLLLFVAPSGIVAPVTPLTIGFEPQTDQLLGTLTAKAIKPGKSGKPAKPLKIKIKEKLAFMNSGNTLVITDANSNVLTSAQVP